MSRYHSDNRITNVQQNITTTVKTQVQIWSATATLRRGRAVALQVGPDGPPNATDCQIVYSVQRATADGTSTVFVPQPTFPGDVASSMVAHNAYTAEGTYGTAGVSIWSRSLNQRASMQWAAQDDQAMLLWPATNLAGLALLALSPTYAGNVLFGMEHEDL